MQTWKNIFGGQTRATRAEHVKKRAVVEIVAHKEAQQEVIEKARRVNQELQELIEENGFHVAIYLATGGTLKRNKHVKEGK